MYWLHALAPLHVGAGAGAGFIDLPILRETVTTWPIVPGSSVKGVIADYHDAAAEQKYRNEDDDAGRLRKAAFGLQSDKQDNSQDRGSA